MVDTWNIHRDDANTNNQGSPGGPGGYNPNLNPPQVTYTSPPQTNNQTNNQNVDVNTGYGADDAKIAAQQKRAAEQKQKYIDKLKGFATSMSSSPGLYGSIYGPEAEEMFNPYDDPTLDRDLYNLEDTAGFSGDIPITEYQKLKFLSDYGLGSGLGSFMMTDSSGNPILTSEFIKDENGNLIPNPSGGGNLILTGLGGHISDNWGDIFDPGGINPKDDEGNPIDYSGVGIREYLEDMSKNYFDQNWYGGDYWDDYLGEYWGPEEQTSYDKNKRWQQKSLGEVLQEGPAGFGDLQRIYGEELSETSGNPFAAVAQYNKQGTFSPSFGETIITEYS